MENLSKEEINRKFVIWERMSNEPAIMEVAKDLILEVIGKLKQAKKQAA